jgi:hypothetical protein
MEIHEAGFLDSPGRQITTPLHCGALGFSLGCSFLANLDYHLFFHVSLSHCPCFSSSLSGKQSMDGWSLRCTSPMSPHLATRAPNPETEAKLGPRHAPLRRAGPSLSLSLPTAENARQTPPIRRIRHLLRLTYPLTCYCVPSLLFPL